MRPFSLRSIALSVALATAVRATTQAELNAECEAVPYCRNSCYGTYCSPMSFKCKSYKKSYYVDCRFVGPPKSEWLSYYRDRCESFRNPCGAPTVTCAPNGKGTPTA